MSKPNGVNVDAMSIVVSPVIHTALVETNNESIYDIGVYVHLGIISRNDPATMKIRKLDARSSDGLVRRPINFSNP